MTKVLNTIENVHRLLAAICTIGMISIVLLQVFSRLCLPFCPSWTEELSRFLYIHAIGFAAPIALRNDLFVKVDIVIDLLPKKFFLVQTLINRIVVLAACIILAYTSYGFMKTGLYETSIALVWPMIVPFSAMFVCGILMLLFSAENVIRDILNIGKEWRSI